MWEIIDTCAVIDISRVESILMKDRKILITYIVEDIRRKILDKFEGEYEAGMVLKELRKGLMVEENPKSVFSLTALKNYDLSNVLMLNIDAEDKRRIISLVKDQRRKSLEFGEYKDKGEAEVVLEELRARLTEHFKSRDRGA